MTQANAEMDTNVLSTQVNDMNSLPSENPQSVSEMDEYNDFISNDETDGLGDISFAEDDTTDSEHQSKSDDKETIEPLQEKAAFFQSKYDLAVNENTKLRQELEMLRNGDVIPDMRQQVIAQLEAENQQQQNKAKSPEPPQMPIMPKDYDQYEAMTDPESVSGKYLKAQQEYQQNILKYQEELVQFNVNEKLNEFKSEQQRIAEMQQMQIQKKQQEAYIENNLITMGMPKEIHSDFGQWLNSPESIKPIVNMFLQMKQRSGAGQQRNSQLQRNSRMPNVSMNVNNASQPLNAQDSFNQARKTRNSDDY